MTPPDRSGSLTGYARLGFARLEDAEARLNELAELLDAPIDAPIDELTADAARAADPDEALDALVRIARRDALALRGVMRDPHARAAIWTLLGASIGFGTFYLRHPDELPALAQPATRLPTRDELRAALAESVGAEDGFAADGGERSWVALRVRYRRMLAQIAVYDLSSVDPVGAMRDVSASLADAAGAALEASLAVARTRLSGGAFPRSQVAATRLAVIGMGKAGARELNYVSDVDVIFVCAADEASDSAPAQGRMIDIATRLATLTMQGVSGVEIEPPLWEVDPNLRPEGKQGALVRTLDSHRAYYDRWAKGWEFQALLKARPLAGDAELGDDYVRAMQPKVWTSAARENFVDNVQRMRERVTEHIPPDDVPYELKLGPGGLRDIEFTVQLLQLVHGLSDDGIRQRGTLDALDALVAEGYVGRGEGAVFARDYRVLRVLEHRLQLRGLSRTHLMPADLDGRRVLARASGLAETGEGVWEVWESVKREVRELHVRLFYRPLLSTMASLPEDERSLSLAQAHDRLAAIGFTDPVGALRHITALTSGLSRTATIQRHLMPVMLRWFGDGADPDNGLLAFRRISERLGATPWFLRMLRDSSAAAESLARVLSGSRYVGQLMEWIPESAAWLDDEELLRPRSGAILQAEAKAIQSRHATATDAMRAVRALRRRELLRIAMAAVLGQLTVGELAAALTTVTEVTIQATLRAVRREVVPAEDAALEFAVIAMGRFGGAELGFGSDADVLYVYRANGVDAQRAQELATQLVAALRTHSEDHRVPLELDADLRPEGRNGPLVRSLDSYREYYRRWSVSWEAQALLRARGVAGSLALSEAFIEMADHIRYPTSVALDDFREIKRIKARVEKERLPQGVPPERHLKLGPGGLSDVEWLVQLLQLQHGHRIDGLRTTSTLDALAAAVDAGLVPASSASRLSGAWRLASRLRSANTLLSGQTSDVLPTDRARLDGIGRLLERPPRSATRVEEDWMGASRRARRIFENLFYG
jgi:glutamate-ammonia-ligase adenylyltransferase